MSTSTEPFDADAVESVDDDFFTEIVGEDEDDDFNNESDSADVASQEVLSSTEVENFDGTVVAVDITAPLTRSEAEELTENIRRTADVLYVLISRAHAGKAWEPLGYKSFAEYVKEEFDISKSRAYQLLDQAKVVEEITAAAPEGTNVKLSEAAARDLKHVIADLAPEIADATEGASPDEASAIIEELIERERQKMNEGSDDDSDEDEDGFGEYDGPYTGNGDFRPRDEEEDDDLGLDEIDDLLDFREDASTVRHRFEAMYAFFTSLTALRDMPEASQVIAWIPEERRMQISSSLPKVIAWLNEFNEQWNAQEWVGELAEQESDETSSDLDSSESEDFEVSADVEDLFEDFDQS